MPPTETAAPLCEAKNIAKDFLLPSGQMLRVVDDVSLAIQPHEVVALLGPSGCGKSTILRIIAGLIQPTAGKVLYHDKPLEGLNPGVAIVFQSFALFPWLTVTENVEVVLTAAGVGAEEAKRRAGEAIATVGLTGFPNAYPRELSGGMKQRAGIARALSLHPEILFLDEPFSQVDALTAESLRVEVVDLWKAKGSPVSSILMVSHDIKEVVFMADRIVVLGANPGRIRTIVENRLPRPRDYSSPEFLKLVDSLHDTITGHEMPDVKGPAAAPEIEPLPVATMSEITGLLEILAARDGKAGLFKLATDTHREFGQMIAIVKAAEMLGMVETPGHQVHLSTKGRSFVEGSHDERLALVREQLLALPFFQLVRDTLAAQPGKEVPQDVIQEAIALHMPHENQHKVFETLIRWGRFGHLLAYNARQRKISLV